MRSVTGGIGQYMLYIGSPHRRAVHSVISIMTPALYLGGFLVLASLSAYTVDALVCYDCTNEQDMKCDVTWGFVGTEGDKYSVTCPEGSNSCRKFVSEPTPGNLLVSRSCSNNTYIPKECTEAFDGLEACLCISSSRKPCNGQRHLEAQYIVTALALIVLVIKNLV